MSQFPYSVLALLLSLAVCGVLYSMSRLKRERQYAVWLATWSFLAVHYIFQILRVETGAPWAWIGDRWFFFLAMLGLLYAARDYAGESRPMPLFAGLAGVGLLWSCAHVFGLVSQRAGPYLGAGVIALLAAATFWQARRLRGSMGVKLLAAVGLLFFLVAPMVSLMPPPVFESFRPTGLITGTFTLLLMAVSMVILAYEGVQRRVEENMMSFSMLNLATSSLQKDADLAGMLEKVLERVLNVHRLTEGLIVVHPGERDPVTRVFHGLAPEFVEHWERDGLDSFISARVARLGGLVMVRDVRDPAALHLLEATPGFERFREALELGGIRALLGITLQTKKRTYGTLLLSHPPPRTFSAAELRMLAALGAQVGMGVENFLLMKHAARRTEELNLLNQTGRALSSTLETEPLLRQIHLEMLKLMDARNLYVAMHDEARGEIRFELEVENGVYLARRTRPMRNALTEHVLRTGQPLLIQDSFDVFLREKGIELSGRPARSWCGAPIIIRGRPVGVMAVQSYDREGAYDQGHLEIFKILAAQAAVALENARLFGEEQKRLRQLTFLHNITRVAISTLNAEEMLAEIAREIQKNFAYDHIGIGLLDYQTKEIELKAEAGLGSQALGKRIPLDTGLIGRVARSGQLALIQDAAVERFTGILLNSRSALCLPIIYADQTLGVLNVESVQPNAILQEDLPILSTLADNLATALHNAFTFQRTREQAITDGLTGVKTYRYFMEALQGEWKRCIRAGRIFSLVLVDLDRFKQVNDRFGHLEGDLVLASLGRILEQRSRQSNVVARYGGDEFMVLMPETSTEHAQILAERLRLWVATDPMFSERDLTASFGLSTFPIHGHTPEEIIRAADAGLYLAKGQGGNRVAVAEQFRQGQAERWRGHVLSSYLEKLSRRIESTGPEVLESLIQRIQEAWTSFPGDPHDLTRAAVEGLTAITDALESRAHGASGHQQNTAFYAMLLTRALGLSEQQKEQVQVAARLHDIGYLGLTPEILENKGKFTREEFAALQEHTVAGARLLEAIRMDPVICDIVRHHHEFLNGRGYPDGLAGERIPVGARILAIAEAYEAIITQRPHRPARTPAEALEELEHFAGTQFDAAMVKAFVQVMKTGAEEKSVGSRQ